MKTQHYDGTVRMPDGSVRRARIRETLHHWMESDELWWKKSDGRLAGQEEHLPRLVLSTIKPFDHVRGANLQTTHKGKVKLATGGTGSYKALRKGKYCWTDSDGVRYVIADRGYAKNGSRLLLETVEPFTAYRADRSAK